MIIAKTELQSANYLKHWKVFMITRRSQGEIKTVIDFRIFIWFVLQIVAQSNHQNWKRNRKIQIALWTKSKFAWPSAFYFASNLKISFWIQTFSLPILIWISSRKSRSIKNGKVVAEIVSRTDTTQVDPDDKNRKKWHVTWNHRKMQSVVCPTHDIRQVAVKFRATKNRQVLTRYSMCTVDRVEDIGEMKYQIDEMRQQIGVVITIAHWDVKVIHRKDITIDERHHRHAWVVTMQKNRSDGADLEMIDTADDRKVKLDPIWK